MYFIRSYKKLHPFNTNLELQIRNITPITGLQICWSRHLHLGKQTWTTTGLDRELTIHNRETKPSNPTITIVKTWRALLQFWLKIFTNSEIGLTPSLIHSNFYVQRLDVQLFPRKTKWVDIFYVQPTKRLNGRKYNPI